MPKLFPKGSTERIEELLTTIAAGWEIDADGGFKTSDFSVILLEGALIQSISSDAATPIEIEKCAKRAIKALLREGSRKVERLEHLFQEEIEHLLVQPLQEFHLVTRCHFRLGAGQSFEIKIEECTARFSDAAPRYDFSEYYAGSIGRVRLDRHSPGAFAVLPVHARSEQAALDLGSQALDVTFGALNYALHFGSFNLMGGAAEPLARAFPGKEIGLFSPDGKRHDDYTLFYSVAPSRVFQTEKDIPSRWERVRSLIWETRSKQLAYYKKFWRLYFQCLADADTETRFLRLWKLAECITFTFKAEDVCARISAPFRDRSLVYAVFESLMRRRNWIAHNANYGVHRGEVFELARDIVDRFILKSASKEFSSIDDWKAYTELGSSRYSVEQLSATVAALRKRDFDSTDAARREGF